ncbi:MAG: DUF1638 domain-containing protein [Acidimicrobiales bacterium]
MTSWPSPAESRSPAVIACGALATAIRHLATRRAWEVDVYSLPSLLHNRPQLIAPRVEELAARLRDRGRRVVVAYADCGTYGALDLVCERMGLHRLRGAHCYDLFAGADCVAELFADEPGTYLLTDFLVRTFRTSVLKELGLDAHPELWDDYFHHYRRLVWLAQDRSADLEAQARAIAERFALPLEVLDVGLMSLERELEELLGPSIRGHKRSVSDAEVARAR